MPLADVADQYFTYESRLSSFQTPQPFSKRRVSTASSKAPKTIKWPNQFLSAEELAKAGFFYYPTQSNPDNAVCFLCHKSLDGWEEDDDPLAEHLKHSSNCGWAIVAAIERQDGELSEEDPASSQMLDARRATFADKWPHESKKGWKCKTKQMAEAGWKYTPTPEYDDTATCTYCSLALDGWESADKPWDEHYKRSPDCPFFTLGSDNKHGAARKSRAKKDRTSKASRLSTQSVFTVASEAPSVTDLPADEEDSILTVATSATAPAEKKMDKKKRTTTGRGRKTKANKSEAVEVDMAPEAEDNDVDVKEVPAPKSTRGRKRKSDQMQDSPTDEIEAEAPASKRRTTRTRGSAAVENVVHVEEAVQRAAEPPAEPTKAKRVIRPSRKASARAASKKVQPPPVPTDEEIDAALKADLEKPVSEDDEPPVVIAPKKTRAASKNVKTTHAMFDPDPMDVDEAAIEAELEALEAESKPPPKPKAPRGKPRKASAKQQATAKKTAAEAEAEARDVADELASDQIASELELSISMQHTPPALKPKKQRAVSRKVSKQVPARNVSASVSVDDNSIIQPDDLQSKMSEENDEDELKEDFGNDTNISMASQSTVVRASTSSLRGSTMKKRGRPSKQRVASRNIEEIVQRGQSTSSSAVEKALEPPAPAKEASPDETFMTEERFYTPAPEFHPVEERRVSEVSKPQPPRPKGRPAKVPPQPVILPSATPPPIEEKQSQSPQSDIENQPPSSRPSTVKKPATPKFTSTRVPLADSTPVMSPSKMNVIACLKSAQPWTTADLDNIFSKNPADENAMGKGLMEDALAKLKNSELTSPEKKMSVEEWILYNAQIAERNLRNECERMVGIFEREGTRAMAALEGVECTE